MAAYYYAAITMEFAKPTHDRNTVDWAGDVLRGPAKALPVYGPNGIDPEDVINNWRSSHAYALNTFQMALRSRALKIDNGAIVAQRSKRRSSIKAKLDRMRDLRLSEMQDIAGCRAIVSSVTQVDELVNSYKHSYSNHELVHEDDYIRKPKSDGYRSYHLIYRYHNSNFPEYGGLKVEIQLRSALQHCWATAVETADIFERQGLKAHQGSPDWRRFFALMGAAIAIREGYKRVPRTPPNWNELTGELHDIALQLNVKTRLTAFGRTLKIIGEADTQRAGIKHVLLVLDPEADNEQLRLIGFRAGNIDEATRQYAERELEKKEGTDAVLVSVSDVTSLRRAYPNYFLDTDVFLQTLDDFISGISD